MTEVHVCEQLVQGCYTKAERPEVEPATDLLSCESKALTVTYYYNLFVK